MSSATERMDQQHLLDRLGGRWLLATLRSIADAVIASDAEDRVVFMNPAAEALTGWSAEEAAGRPLGEIFRLVGAGDGPRAGFVAERREAIGRGELVSSPADAGLVRKDGSEAPIEGTWAPIRGEEGRLVGSVISCRDIGGRKGAESRRECQAQRLRLQVDRMPLACIMCDLDFRIVSWNPAAGQMFGLTGGEALGESPYGLLIPPSARDHIREIERRVRTGDMFAHGVNEITTEDGRTITCEWHNTPLEDGRGEVVGVLSMAKDITDRVRAEGALRDVHQRLQALVRASPLAIIALDARGHVTIWNPAAERIFGWGEPEVLGRPLPTIPPDLQQEFRSGLAASLRGVIHAGHETHRLRKDGSRIAVSLWTAPLYDARGEACGRMGVIEDITDRKRAEAARSELMWRLVTAQEEERHRIARELHDQMGQYLAALLLGLKALEGQARDRTAAEALRRLQELANQIGQEVHRIALELRPTALDDWGLQTTLSNYVKEWSRRSRVMVQLHCAGIDRRRLPAPVETALYRIAQEALTNVLKHAQASRVSLIVERRPDHALAIVEDDGRGFDVDMVLGDPDARRRLGLLGMEERAAQVGGRLEVESSPGGTTLFVHIPLPSDGGAADHG